MNPDIPTMTPEELKVVESGYCPNTKCELAELDSTPMWDEKGNFIGTIFHICPVCRHIYITKAKDE